MKITKRNWRLFRRLCLFLAISFLLLWAFLPYNHPVRLAIQFNTGALLRSTRGRSRYDLRSVPFPVDLADEVALIIKSGFGTIDRIATAAQLLSNATPVPPDHIILAADFATQPGRHITWSNSTIPVDDVVALALEKAQDTTGVSSARAHKHGRLRDAIGKGRLDTAHELSEEFGWEIDAMKFISSLDSAYSRMPDKKWYVLADDDTYIFWPSLEWLIGQLDHTKAYYLGNAIGSWDKRFAHGGSAIVLSQATIHRLFIQHPEVAVAANLEATQAALGDLLLAEALMKVGVYVEEKYGHFFNGELPAIAKIRQDRLCTPIISFHGIKQPEDLFSVHAAYENLSEPSLWADIWDLYGGPDMGTFAAGSVRESWDHVGRLDEITTTVKNIETAEQCRQLCLRHRQSCLAWTWEGGKRACHASPWMIVGRPVAGKVSGVNMPRWKDVISTCKH